MAKPAFNTLPRSKKHLEYTTNENYEHAINLNSGEHPPPKEASTPVEVPFSQRDKVNALNGGGQDTAASEQDSEVNNAIQNGGLPKPNKLCQVSNVAEDKKLDESHEAGDVSSESAIEQKDTQDASNVKADFDQSHDSGQKTKNAKPKSQAQE